MDDKKPHPEVMSEGMKRTLGELARLAAVAPFYLAGGTGLALHLGHRRSHDLDLFHPEGFDEEVLLEQLRRMPGFSLVGKAPQTVHAAIRGTKVSFLAYRYPVLFPETTWVGARLADVRDIACMKISAIAGRGSKRDFFDVYAAARRFGLAELLELFQRKYASVAYDPVHLLKSLTWFADAEEEPMPDLLWAVGWAEVKEFFAREAPRLV